MYNVINSRVFKLKLKEIKIITVEPQLSEPHGRRTIRSDNQGVQIDDESRNSPCMGYRVGDN